LVAGFYYRYVMGEPVTGVMLDCDPGSTSNNWKINSFRAKIGYLATKRPAAFWDSYNVGFFDGSARGVSDHNRVKTSSTTYYAEVWSFGNWLAAQ